MIVFGVRRTCSLFWGVVLCISPSVAFHASSCVRLPSAFMKGSVDLDGRSRFGSLPGHHHGVMRWPSSTQLCEKRQRKRRKTVEEDDVLAPETPQNIEKPKPRADAPVSLKVQDIRQVVNGKDATSTLKSEKPTDAFEITSTKSPVMESDTGRQIISDKIISSSRSGDIPDDSMQQLLIDAAAMKSGTKVSETLEEPSSGVSKKIRDAVSTLVVVDFFVVCGFLLWFLAGIFCSSVLQDDTVQIAFNSNFQQLVQPALGVLMIGAIASAVTKEEDQ